MLLTSCMVSTLSVGTWQNRACRGRERGGESAAGAWVGSERRQGWKMHCHALPRMLPPTPYDHVTPPSCSPPMSPMTMSLPLHVAPPMSPWTIPLLIKTLSLLFVG